MKKMRGFKRLIGCLVGGCFVFMLLRAVQPIELLAEKQTCLLPTACEANAKNQGLQLEVFETLGLVSHEEYLDVYVLDVYTQTMNVQTIQVQVEGTLSTLPVLNTLFSSAQKESRREIQPGAFVSEEAERALLQEDAHRYTILTQEEAVEWLQFQSSEDGHGLKQTFKSDFNRLANRWLFELRVKEILTNESLTFEEILAAQLVLSSQLNTLAEDYLLTETQAAGAFYQATLLVIEEWAWFYGEEWAEVQNQVLLDWLTCY